MSFFGDFIQRSLGGGSSGGGNLRDYQHASKIFRPGSFDLAPKFKFLFHTYFDINPIAYNKNVGTGDNFGVLVKSVKLPSFSIKTHELNQYNRKRIVQTKISYDSVNISFHDDNINMITKLWDAYYTYYYKDGSNLNGLFKGTRGSSSASNEPGVGAANQAYNRRNIYMGDITGENNWGYLGESYSPNTLIKAPFFRNITVFGFNRHKFTAYSLINPLITKFDHDQYSYADGAGTMELKMDIAYETVAYNEGALDGRSPDNVVKGFGLDAFYDKKTSPITNPATQSLVPGQGTYLDADGGYIHPLSDAERISNVYKNYQASGDTDSWAP